MAEYITTYTGVDFFPLVPVKDDIRIEDIAHSLSLLCRANGHYADFYSVAAHCINCYQEACARTETPRVKLACLLHDAAEAYISDIPRPVKLDMPGVEEIEDRLLNAIYEKFLGSALTDYEQQIVKIIDDAMLYYEFYEYKGVKLIEEFPYVAATPLFYDDTPAHVEREYLEIFRSIDISSQTDPKEYDVKLRLKGTTEEKTTFSLREEI